LPIAERVGLTPWVIYLARNQLAETGTALSAATTIGNQYVSGVGGVQQGLLRSALESFAIG
jgi:hypothetical protein